MHFVAESSVARSRAGHSYVQEYSQVLRLPLS